MEPDHIFDELQQCKDDMPIFRRLISIASLHKSSTEENIKKWHTPLTYLLEIISSNTEMGNERILLASQTFYALLSTQCKLQFLKDTVIYLQELNSSNVYFLERDYAICDLELFKLLNAYGYLQVNQKNIFFDDAFIIMFNVIYNNCIKYTKYSYFAYKVLYIWLKRTCNIYFWHKNDYTLEQKLETVIFSNCSNALNDVCKQNTLILNMYLRIMSEKYDGFLQYIFEEINKNMSWQNETKYIILAEVCNVWNNIEAMTMKDFLYGLCTSLTKHYLRSGGTKLYLVILKKLDEEKWKKSFGEVMKFVIYHWESEQHRDCDALQWLFKYWLEPTIEIYRNILPFLWEISKDIQDQFFLSHLRKAAARLHIELSQIHEINNYINDKEEIIRLNSFIVLCYRVSDLIDINRTDPFFLIKQFLWSNANTTTILMREGIIKYFKILYSNILKIANIRTDCVVFIFEFTEWLHEYLLDCFEIGSCYQRKILGLNLYKILLSFTNVNIDSTYKDRAHYHMIINKHLKTTNSWRFTDKRSLLVLLRLVLDSTLDVKQLATGLILEYFEKDIISATEKHVLYNCAWEHCNSFKFYEIESGAALMKIILHWLPFTEIYKILNTFQNDQHNDIYVCSSYSELLLNEARKQLVHMKEDMLKAITYHKPFYGVLTALLTVAFRGGPENQILTPQFRKNVLHLVKDSVDFFLFTLSTETSSTVYSSSFAEMGLAINEKIKTSEIDFNYDELQLSPAYQALILCIWMSLKVSCEILSEIGMLMQLDTEVKDSMNVIVTILMKCRHKGVVESAGVAIANLSRCLYNNKEFSELPKTYLTSLLQEDTSKLLHLTRRGAGLSIMFHKLIISDNRKDRPIVHFAVQMLIHSLTNFSKEAVKDVEIGKDSPWAKRLHFLRTLVIDKEIHMQLVPYMEDICLTCFEYMKSDIWIVRNASLQLYGAIVPRLVGQCSGKDKILDFGNGYSISHFVTHYPALTSYILAQLDNISKLHGTSSTMLRSYSNIVHILILLSKLSIASSDVIDYPSQEFTIKIKNLLYIFFNNPMIYVRQLAAKAYAALTPFVNINLEINMIKQRALLIRDINMSHGCFLAVRYLKEKCIANMENINIYYKPNHLALQRYTKSIRYHDIVKAWKNISNYKTVIQPCYINEILFLQESEFMLNRIFLIDMLIFDDGTPDIKHIIPSQKIQPGFFQFVGLSAQLYAEYVKHTSNINLEIIRKILNSNCVEQSIEFLRCLSYCTALLEFILKYLISIHNNCHQLLLHEVVKFTLKTIHHTSLETNELELNEIIKEFHTIEITVTNPNIIRVKNALILAFSKNETLINEVLLHIFSISMNIEESIRMIAMEYIELSLHYFTQLKDKNKLIIMQCCLILLKDEIAEIREAVSISLQKYIFRDINPMCRLQCEEIVYQQVLLEIICLQLNTELANDNINFIRYFTHAIKDINLDVTIENPFHHDNSTFYKEESKFLNMYLFYTRCKKNDDLSCSNKAIHRKHFDVTRAMHIRCELQEKAGFNYDDLQTILYLKEMDYLIRKRDIVLQTH